MPKTHYKLDRSAVRDGERRDRDAERETAERHGFYQYQRFVLVPIGQVAHQPVWHPGRIKSILDAIDRGKPLPPIRADKDRGKYAITDGIHRYNASLQRGFTHIPVLETVTVDAPEMYAPPMPEKPVLRPGTYVKLTEKPYRATSLWARVVEHLGPYRGRGDVIRHVYALDGIVDGHVDFVGDWHDDKFDVGRPPRDVQQAFEDEEVNMGKKASTYPVTSVATAIFNESGQVLILRRGSTAPWMPGKWSLPGGVVDPGEGLRQAAIREAVEETTLRVRSASSLAVLDHAPEGWAAAFFVSGPGEWSGEVKLDYENDAYAWISASEIGGYSFIPTVKEALMKAFRSSSASRVASRYVEAGLLKAPPAMVKEITEWVQANVARGLVINADDNTKRHQRLREEDRGEDPVDPEAYDLARKDSGGSTRFEDKKVFPVDLKGWPYLRSFRKSIGKEIAETERRLEWEQEKHRNKVDAAKVISRMDQTLIQDGGSAALRAVMEAHPDLDKLATNQLVYFYDPANFNVPEEPSLMVPAFLRTLFDIPQKEGGKFTKRTVSEIRTLLKKVGSMPPLKIAEALLSDRKPRKSIYNLDEITVEIMWGNEAKASKGVYGVWYPSSHRLLVYPMNMRGDPLGDIVWYRSLKNMIATAVDHELQHMTQDLIQILGGLSEAGGLPSRNVRRTRTPAESGSQMLSEGEKYYLLDKEFYTWLTTSVRNFLNDMAYLEMDKATPREWDRNRKVYIDLSAFFKTLKKHEPAKWKKAVGEFWKATEQPRSSRVASRHIEARSRCRGCGGPIRHAPHHPAMEGYCGYCAFDEFDM